MQDTNDMLVPKQADGRRRRQGGFSLVELMVGLSIFVVSLMALIQIAAVTNQARRASRERQAAWLAVTEQLRQVENTPFANLQATWNGRGFPIFLEDSVNAGLRALPGDPDGLPGLVSVTVPASMNDPNLLLEVTVRVDWVASSSPQTISRSVRISLPGAGL